MKVRVSIGLNIVLELTTDLNIRSNNKVCVTVIMTVNSVCVDSNANSIMNVCGLHRDRLESQKLYLCFLVFIYSVGSISVCELNT